MTFPIALRLLIASVFCLLVPHVALGVEGLNQGVKPVNWEQLHPAATFDMNLPTIEQVAGVSLGQRPIRADEVLAYCRALAAASDRATVIEYARSHEGRPLILLAISESKTIAELDQFQATHSYQMDPRNVGVPTVEELDNSKAVAWMAYGIHGDELSSTDAAAALAYWLVAGTDEEAARLRENLVVLIDPCENPDGRSRYLAQTMSFAHRTANPDQDDLSHRSVWPWGRGNHYLFDVNRDWFSMTQPESQRSRYIAQWLPQLLVDSHEMSANATYLFPPARHPFNPHLPDNNHKWKHAMAGDQAKALDARGYPYYSGEWNEEFFPGYGSSWAGYHGTIGILYEMSRTTGTLVQKKGGAKRTFAQAIDHQFTSSLSNLRTLAEHQTSILHDHIAARSQVMEDGRKAAAKAWVFPPDERHPERHVKLAQLLIDQGVEVQVLNKATQFGGLMDIRTGEKSDHQLPVQTLMVRMDQPAGALARVLLDPHIPMETKFFQEERLYLEKKNRSRLYETTCWSLPLAHGVPAFWTGKIPGGDWTSFHWEDDKSAIVIPEKFSSLIIDGDPDHSPRVLADLLAAGINVRIAEKNFTISGHAFHSGAMVIRREANTHHLLGRLEPILAEHGVQPVAINTSRSSDGPDMGGTHFDVLVPPRVGVVAGMPISPTEFGAVWHLLDQELDLRFSNLDISRLGRTDLSRYNVLIFPPVMGGPAMYRQNIGPGGMEKIREWVRAGGTAIGLAGGARMLADEKTELTVARFRDQALAIHPPAVWSLSPAEAAAAGRIQATGMRVENPLPEGAVPANVHGSLYDVAPIIGPGAAPFVEGRDQGTPLATQPMTLNDWVKATLAQGKPAPDEFDLAEADQRLRKFMPQGAFLRADLDDEYWLNFGLGQEATIWFGRSETIVAQSPVRVSAIFPEIKRMHLGGLLWPEGAARMVNTAYVTREAVGRGQVILFAANPVFRRWMKESERMLCNAILMGPGLGSRWSTPW